MLLTTEQRVKITLAVLTAAGNPAVIDGNPVWASSDSAVARVESDANDPMSAYVYAGDQGIAQITAVCDADLDNDETREITGFLDVTVVPAEAATVQLVAGTPELQ